LPILIPNPSEGLFNLGAKAVEESAVGRGNPACPEYLFPEAGLLAGHAHN